MKETTDNILGACIIIATCIAVICLLRWGGGQHKPHQRQPMTITEFQTYRGLTPDGIAGPVTVNEWIGFSAEKEREQFNQNAIDTSGGCYEDQ